MASDPPRRRSSGLVSAGFCHLLDSYLTCSVANGRSTDGRRCDVDSRAISRHPRLYFLALVPRSSMRSVKSGAENERCRSVDSSQHASETTSRPRSPSQILRGLSNGRIHRNAEHTNTSYDRLFDVAKGGQERRRDSRCCWWFMRSPLGSVASLGICLGPPAFTKPCSLGLNALWCWKKMIAPAFLAMTAMEEASTSCKHWPEQRVDLTP